VTKNQADALFPAAYRPNRGSWASPWPPLPSPAGRGGT
jgi:hypothetical protein